MEPKQPSGGARRYLGEIYPETRFGGYSHFDGTLRFYSRVQALLADTDDCVVLNFGCGRGAHAEHSEGVVRSAQTFRKKCKLVIGVDVDSVGRGNQEIDEFRLIEGPRLPVDDGSIGLCVSDWTVEHLSDIPGFFSECARVVRTGGYLCFRTPNRFHFSSLGASMIPTRYHHSIRRMLGQFHEADDVFPTLYRCNTRQSCVRELERSGFEPLVYVHHGESHFAGRGAMVGRIGQMDRSNVTVLSPSRDPCLRPPCRAGILMSGRIRSLADGSNPTRNSTSIQLEKCLPRMP